MYRLVKPILSRSVLLDNIGCLFGNGNDRSDGVPTDLIRKDRRIDDAEALDAKDSQARVNHAGIERGADARSRRLRKSRVRLVPALMAKKVPLTGWNAALQCSRMNSLISPSVICGAAQ